MVKSRGLPAPFTGTGPLRLLEIGAGKRSDLDSWPEVAAARASLRRIELVRNDIVPFDGVDVVHDLSKRPWPFRDAEFDGVVAVQVLEHLEDLGEVMEEICRIVKPGGRALVEVPYALSKAYFQDFTHKTPFTENTFDYFAPDGEAPPWSDYNYYSRARLRTKRLEVIPDLAPFMGVGPHGIEKYLGNATLRATRFLFDRGPLAMRFVLEVVGLKG
ncbi:MAG: class I SAM-dependent methyltransferase [Euryarchaeota archaeon]|nr:class I SAM-dependent methyltransferase [Euryarchaeota archaeon]